MFEKSFQEMMTVDVRPFLTSREDNQNIKYLPWAACKKLLHDNGAETVMFWPVPGPDGSSLRMSDHSFTDKNGVTNRCYEVLVHIQVDGIQWETCYPVMNGDKPVKDNSMTQQRLHNAIRRAFVKGVAERLGLGFSLWLDVDDIPEAVEEDLSKHSLMKCKQRMTELVTFKIDREGIPFATIANRLGLEPDELRGKFALYGELVKLEKAIGEMKP